MFDGVHALIKPHQTQNHCNDQVYKVAIVCLNSNDLSVEPGVLLKVSHATTLDVVDFQVFVLGVIMHAVKAELLPLVCDVLKLAVSALVQDEF